MQEVSQIPGRAVGEVTGYAIWRAHTQAKGTAKQLGMWVSLVISFIFQEKLGIWNFV